nr:MAG TPA: hypothetical protein [Caudoviricetes sp.]DAV64431.1 MAG TPA: hypothetical protein [Caudoviricetes sp.]
MCILPSTSYMHMSLFNRFSSYYIRISNGANRIPWFEIILQLEKIKR